MRNIARKAAPIPPRDDAKPSINMPRPGVTAMNADTDTVKNVETIPTAETASRRGEASRRNGARSKGPKTAEGKARVRLNALKHGLTAKTVVLPNESVEQLEHRIEAWKAEFLPRSEVEDYLVERAVHASWALDRAERTIAARLTDLVQYGTLDRDEAEADLVEDDSRRLFWDPRGPIALYPHWRGLRVTPRLSWPDSVEDPLNPARIVNRLEGTLTGCQWLLDRWADLRRILERKLKWQAPDRLRAIRLLGRQPMDLLTDERVLMIYLACDAMDPTAPTSLDDMMTETDDEDLERIKEGVRGRGADQMKPASPEAGKAALLDLIAPMASRLEVKLSVHRQRREFEKAMQMDLLAFDDSKEGELMRRYQLAKDREVHRAINALFKVRKETLNVNGGDLPVASCMDGDADMVTAVGLSNGLGDETNPDPPGPVLESLLQAAGPMEIPAEAGTPTIQPPESVPQAAVEIGPGGETNPNTPDPPSDETNPRPVEPTSTIHAEPTVPPAVLSTIPEYLAAVMARQDPSRPYPPMAIEALKALEREWMS